MKSIELLEWLKSQRKPVFSVKDLSKILGKPPRYCSLVLKRLEKQGRIKRIERGKFFVDADAVAVATNIVFPSYLSFFSALAFHQLTTQLPIVLQVAVLRQKKSVSVNGARIKFIKLSEKKFFGFQKVFLSNKIAFVAEPEKAVVDCLCLPRYCPVSEVFEALKEGNLEEKKLVDYARKTGSSVAAKRLGYLMLLLGKNVSGLKELVNAKYDLLNPLKPKKGAKNKEWKILVNEVLEQNDFAAGVE